MVLARCLHSCDTSEGKMMGTKVVEIGDWNMDSTSSKNVAHGLTLAHIREISAIIRNDADSEYHDLSSDTTTDDSTTSVKADSTNVILRRIPGGEFDNSNFNSTSYNRGWVKIMYIAYA